MQKFPAPVERRWERARIPLVGVKRSLINFPAGVADSRMHDRAEVKFDSDRTGGQCRTASMMWSQAGNDTDCSIKNFKPWPQQRLRKSS